MTSEGPGIWTKLRCSCSINQAQRLALLLMNSPQTAKLCKGMGGDASSLSRSWAGLMLRHKDGVGGVRSSCHLTLNPINPRFRVRPWRCRGCNANRQLREPQTLAPKPRNFCLSWKQGRLVFFVFPALAERIYPRAVL